MVNLWRFICVKYVLLIGNSQVLTSFIGLFPLIVRCFANSQSYFVLLNFFLAVVSTLKYNKINSLIEQVNKIGNFKMKMRLFLTCVCVYWSEIFLQHTMTENIHENI